jgi:anti-anti-sigma factor
MSVEIEVDQNNQSIRIKGDLVSSTVMQAMQQFTRECKALAQWVIDLSDVSRVDSTAIALLIELKRQAKGSNKAVRFLHLPQTLLTIAHLSQVEALLQEDV